MIETDRRITAIAPPACPPDFAERIASLRVAGADQFDPLPLRYIAALTERADTHQGRVKHILDAKAAQALAAFEKRFEHAKRDAGYAITQCERDYPHGASDLKRLFAAGDFKGVKRCIATLKAKGQCASLSALVRRLEHHFPEYAGAPVDLLAGANAGSRPELKTIRDFRNTWSQLSVDRQVALALEQAPSNAGPINSHMLILRSLAMMRDISPDYLSRFIAYADALLCLDECDKEKHAVPKKPRAVKK